MSGTARSALVTSATRGIGEAIARELARRGLRVVVGGRDSTRGERIAKELGGGASFLVARRRGSEEPRARCVVMVSSGMGELSCLGDARRAEITSPTLDRAALRRGGRRDAHVARPPRP